MKNQILARTPEEKKKLAEMVDAETLEFVKTVSGAFGILDAVAVVQHNGKLCTACQHGPDCTLGRWVKPNKPSPHATECRLIKRGHAMVGYTPVTSFLQMED